MPRCLNCGNTERFVSSQITSSKHFHQPHGMAGQFTETGDLAHLENNNAPLEIYDQALQAPEHVFDTCHNCGSTNVRW